MKEVLIKELQFFIRVESRPPEYDRVATNWQNRVGHRFRIITKDRVAFFVNMDIMRAL